tara:strand:- start:3 stop:275 length:273 start_codon:yes stop_codon:yes gene_type:complete
LQRSRPPAQRGGEGQRVIEQQVLQRAVDEQEDARLALAVDTVHLEPRLEAEQQRIQLGARRWQRPRRERTQRLLAGAERLVEVVDRRHVT